MVTKRLLTNFKQSALHRIPLVSSLLLQDLNLAQSTKLAEVNISSPNLVNLNLSACSALIKLDLRCPNLETLKLAQCSSLEELGEMQCPSLKMLSLFQCRQLTADAMSDVLAGEVAFQGHLFGVLTGNTPEFGW